MRVSIDWLREYIDFDCPLSELADGLTMAGLEVEESIKIGADEFAEHGGSGSKDDTAFDAKVTPNRGDWLSMIGVAREAAPLVGGQVRIPEPKVEDSDPEASELIKISIADPDLCRRYVGVVVRGVRIGDSPDWMKDRLIAAGLRPINNVVDITNYVMIEFGQPLHAFDYSLLHGAQIIVRRARPGETIVSIDDVERKLDPDMLVIADADRPVAIAGIMGGADSEVGEQTQDIFVESANFDSVSIRRTSKRSGMVTESSYRFERVVDPSITATGAVRAAELMRDLAGGKIAGGVVDVYPCPVEPLEVTVRPERVNAVLGTTLEADAMVGYLNALHIQTCLQDGLLVSRVPTFRPDVTREIDLVEEVGRAYGYDKLEMTLPDAPLQGKDSPQGVFTQKIRQVLISCGAQEVLTHSLVHAKFADLARKSDRCLRIRNPLSEELDAMRATLIPNLLQVIERNQAFGTSDVSIFEIGKVYFGGADDRIGENLSVSGAVVGNLWNKGWSLPVEAFEADFFVCKGIVEALLGRLGIGPVMFEETKDPLLHPMRSAKVIADGRDLGIVGEVSPDVREALDLRGRPCVFELDFEALMDLAPSVSSYGQLPKYPPLHRHVAAVVHDSVKYEQLVNSVLASGKGTVEGVELLDVYKGEQIDPDQRSLTLSIVFRSPDRTLKDDEVNEVLGGIKEALAREVAATFR